MSTDKHINISSSGIMHSKLALGGKEHIVLTKPSGKYQNIALTVVYKNGQIISDKKTKCPGDPATVDFRNKLKQLMAVQHGAALKSLDLKAAPAPAPKAAPAPAPKATPAPEPEVAPAPEPEEAPAKSVNDYLGEVRGFIRKKMDREAFGLIDEAHTAYPDEPLIMSYFGALSARAGKNRKRAVGLCQTAIRTYKDNFPHGRKSYFGTLYLNLGRAYMAIGDKQGAVASLETGLRYDPKSKDINREFITMGIRQAPPIPFLERSNPINKQLGMLRHKRKKKK